MIEPSLVQSSNCNKTNWNNTNEKDQTNKSFDFESLFEIFPKRNDGNVRKSKGMAACRAKIKTPEQFDKLGSATRNYAAHIEGMKRKVWDFKSIFSWYTFIANDEWLDWIERESPKKLESEPGLITFGKTEPRTEDEPWI